MKLLLNDVAETLRLHPRTVIRAITDNKNAGWNLNYNPAVELNEVLGSYSIRKIDFVDAYEGKDVFITRHEAADELGVSVNTFTRFEIKPDMAFSRKTRRWLKTRIVALKELTMKA